MPEGAVGGTLGGASQAVGGANDDDDSFGPRKTAEGKMFGV